MGWWGGGVVGLWGYGVMGLWGYGVMGLWGVHAANPVHIVHIVHKMGGDRANDMV